MATTSRSNRAKSPSVVAQATALARTGAHEEALATLRALAEAPTVAKTSAAAKQAETQRVAASAACTVLYAFRFEWEPCARHALVLLENPLAVDTENVFTEVAGLLRRAARELGAPELIEQANARVPATHQSFAQASLARDFVPPSAEPGPPNVAAYEKAVAMAHAMKRFHGKPHELAAHVFALAVAFKHDEALIEHYDAANPRMHFDHALSAARALVRRGEVSRALALLFAGLPRWMPVDAAQVAPVELLIDPTVAPHIDRARAREVLATPRGLP